MDIFLCLDKYTMDIYKTLHYNLAPILDHHLWLSSIVMSLLQIILSLEKLNFAESNLNSQINVEWVFIKVLLKQAPTLFDHIT